jgi:hypothetical protein
MSKEIELLPILLQYQLLLKIYHWQTKIYARHKASDELYNHVTEFIDHLVEYESSTSRLTIKPYHIVIHNMSDENAISFLESFSAIVERISSKNKGVRARRDDLIGFIYQTIYLYHLS